MKVSLQAYLIAVVNEESGQYSLGFIGGVQVHFVRKIGRMFRQHVHLILLIQYENGFEKITFRIMQ